MGKTIHHSSTRDGLTVKAYLGDGAAMLAFDLDEHLTKGLAGFAIKRTPPRGEAEYLPNHLSFSSKVHSGTKTEDIPLTASNEAPFQKFRWLDFEPVLGKYTYEVTAMYHGHGDALTEGPTASVSFDSAHYLNGKLEIGFTRGYLSSQAYARRFNNAEIRATPKSIDFDTGPYEAQYEWLGYHARKMMIDFLDECVNDPSVTVDLFAYDIDEPDVLRRLAQLGKRLRAFLDDAPLHTKEGALEIDAKKLLLGSAGHAHVKTGHFKRFSHSKVMIQKKDGKPVKVLTGSANFSVRGLYVQANNVLVFHDPTTAELYESVFEEAWNDMSGFAKSSLAGAWHDVRERGLPRFSACFSPHKDSSVSLDRVAQAMKNARSSIMFAVMELGGSGPVLDGLKELMDHKKVLSYGMTQSAEGLRLYKPNKTDGVFASFNYLREKVPGAFREEWSGGMGQVIHHKFVVVDFNDLEPVVFTGSSNLAGGGEEDNGDNLIAIEDPSVATAYAIEAIRLVDHYHFRAEMAQASEDEPLRLRRSGDAGKEWWRPYYDPSARERHERLVFSR